jgi:hypothetical protein
VPLSILFLPSSSYKQTNKQTFLNFISLHSMLSLCENLPTIIAMFTSLHAFTISMLQLYMLWEKMCKSTTWTWEVVLLRILTMSLAMRIFPSCLCKNLFLHKLKTNTSLINFVGFPNFAKTYENSLFHLTTSSLKIVDKNNSSDHS